jgi:hypothetical protein
MYKILSLTVIGCLLLTIAHSQGVAINSDGSAPDTSAMLDVKSSNKGVLIPRLSLTGIHDSATIHFPKTSLLVYNTATAGGLTPGFYYWNVDTWTSFGGFNYVLQQNLNTNGKYISGDGGNNGLFLDSNGIILSTGAQGFGKTLQNTVYGPKLIWYPRKAALRAGYSNSNQWDDVNIGDNSIGLGYETQATGFGSVAMGDGATASNEDAVAIGLGDVASGQFALAIGTNSIASANNSTAVGSWSNAKANFSTAVGYNCQAKGLNSMAVGDGTVTDEAATGAAAMGSATYVQGQYGTAMGRLSQAYGYASTAMGYSSHALADNSISMGSNSNAGQPYSFAAGDSVLANGAHSFALGSKVNTTGNNSFALGNSITAGGANGFALGNYVTANGANCFALGNYVTTNYLGSFIIGDRSTTNIATSNSTNQMTMRFDNGYRLFTNSATTVGVMLAGGGNAWSTISDVHKKENFEPVDGEDFLQKISAMPLTTWNYKGQDPSRNRHYGPMAQDFYTAFGKDEYGTIGNDTTINQADFDGINFIGIQALEKRTSDLKETNAQLKDQNAQLKTAIEELQARLKKQQELDQVRDQDIKKLKDQLESLTKLVTVLSARP